jgi:putative tryptophan/tyrosine transport system substrate-binding protein
MNRYIARILVALAWAVGLCWPPAQAQTPVHEQPFHIFMVLLRGETDIERGFAEFMREARIPVQLTVRIINGDKALLPGIVEEIRATKPDLVYTWGTTVTIGIAGEVGHVDPAVNITDIPVLFTLVAYPVQGGIVSSLQAPGRNVSGSTFLAPIETQLRAIAAYRPFKKLAVVYNPAEANSLINIADLREQAHANKFELIEKPAPLDALGRPDGAAVPELVHQAKREGADFLYIGPDSFTAVNADALTSAAREDGLPSFASTEAPLRTSWPMMGLVSNYFTLGKLTGRQAQRILLEGADPASLPVASLSRHSLMLNMPVVRALGIFPPMRMLTIAEILDPQAGDTVSSTP